MHLIAASLFLPLLLLTTHHLLTALSASALRERSRLHSAGVSRTCWRGLEAEVSRLTRELAEAKQTLREQGHDDAGDVEGLLDEKDHPLKLIREAEDLFVRATDGKVLGHACRQDIARWRDRLPKRPEATTTPDEPSPTGASPDASPRPLGNSFRVSRQCLTPLFWLSVT